MPYRIEGECCALTISVLIRCLWHLDPVSCPISWLKTPSSKRLCVDGTDVWDWLAFYECVRVPNKYDIAEKLTNLVFYLAGVSDLGCNNMSYLTWFDF